MIFKYFSLGPSQLDGAHPPAASGPMVPQQRVPVDPGLPTVLRPLRVVPVPVRRPFGPRHSHPPIGPVFHPKCAHFPEDFRDLRRFLLCELNFIS